MNADIAHFDALHREPDPWGYHTRWYEARKRDLVLASLTHEHYRCALELGCSNGAFTQALATRCNELVATDASPRAVELARAALAHVPHVRVLEQRHPEQWPEGRYDLIVVGDMGYYLDAKALDALAGRITGSLLPDGLLVAAHWRHPAHDRVLDTDTVHGLFDGLGLPCVFEYRDADVRIQGWSRDARSVAQREGLA